MESPHRPPIASPDGNVVPLPLVPTARGDWKTAPKIVRSWAYQLTWLGIVILPFIIFGALFSARSMGSERITIAVLYAILLAVDIWLNRALKKGAAAAWTVQIILSCLGLLAFPLGTAIHAYILSQWFKPETKAWFGQS